MGDYTAQTRKHRRTHTQTSAIGLVTKPLGLTCFFRRQENCTAQIHVRTHKQRQKPVIKPSALTLLLQAPGKLHGSGTRARTHKQWQKPVIKPSALTLLLQAPGKLHGSGTHAHSADDPLCEQAGLVSRTLKRGPV